MEKDREDMTISQEDIDNFRSLSASDVQQFAMDIAHTEALQINEIYDKLWLIYNVGNSIRGSTRQEYVKRIFELLGELGL